MINTRKGVALMALLLSTSGCGTDFWGNPIPPPGPEASPTCVRHEVAPAPYDPYHGNRPPEIPPGYRWQVLVLEVLALGPPAEDDNTVRTNYCVPFQVHVYASMAGVPPLTIYDSGTVHPVPYDKQRTTPWVTWIVLGYDPKSERFQGRDVPSYDVDLVATYLPQLDTANEPPEAFACLLAIKTITATVRSDIRPRPGLSPGTSTVRCRLQGHASWNSY